VCVCEIETEKEREKERESVCIYESGCVHTRSRRENGAFELRMCLGALGGDDLHINTRVLEGNKRHTMFAPSRAARRAMASPIPREAPVMN
jgi:hypothetical protein